MAIVDGRVAVPPGSSPTGQAPAGLDAPRVDPSRCTVPPEGWWCSREPGHEGPCAARTVSGEAFDRIWAQAEAEEARRATDMPTEQDAVKAMFSAYLRLKELGWNDAIYCPKDGSSFDVIEAGSSGIHRAHYQGEWPTGTWWVESEQDLWPSRPVLYRPTEAELERRARFRQAHRDSDGSPKGGDAKQGSIEDDSAVPIGQSPNPSRSTQVSSEQGEA